MAIKYSYSFTAKAERDLDEVLSYIVNDLANPTAAAELAKSVFDNIENLTLFPETGKKSGQQIFVRQRYSTNNN